MTNSIAQSIRVITVDHVITVYIFSSAVPMFLFLIIFPFNFLLWRHTLLIKQSTMQFSAELGYLPGLHQQGWCYKYLLGRTTVSLFLLPCFDQVNSVALPKPPQGAASSSIGTVYLLKGRLLLKSVVDVLEADYKLLGKESIRATVCQIFSCKLIKKESAEQMEILVLWRERITHRGGGGST